MENVKEMSLSDKATAENVKFQIEFALMMLMCGRTSEGEKAFQKALDYLNVMIEKEKEGE